MFGRVPGTRPNIGESHSEISTRVPFCIAARRRGLMVDAGRRFFPMDTLEDLLTTMAANKLNVLHL